MNENMYEARRRELDRTVLLFDVLATIAIFLLSFYFRSHYPQRGFVDIYSHLFLIPLLLTLLISFLSYFGAYKSPHDATLVDYSWSIFRGLMLTIGVILSLLFFLKIQ